MVREATADDVPRLVEMGARFIAETGYSAHLTASTEQMKTTAEWIIATGGMVFVFEVDGRVVGMVAVMVYPHPFSGELTGNELFWWVEPEHRGGGYRLMRAAERWCEARGAVAMQMVAPNQKVADFYARCGYVPLEQVYQRRFA